MTSTILREAFERYLESVTQKVPAMFAALVVLALFIIIAGTVRLIAQHVRGRRAILIARLIQVTLAMVALIIALGIMGVNVTGLVAALGLLSVGISFALQELLVNFLAGLQLLGQAPFERGDQITVNEVTGTVRSIGSRAVKLDGKDGEIIHVPNRDLLLKPVRVKKKNSLSR